MKVDVCEYEAVGLWISETMKRFGRLDGAANVAGIIPKSIGISSMAEQDLDDWNLVFSVSPQGVNKKMFTIQGLTKTIFVVVLINAIVHAGQRYWHDALYEGSTQSHE